METGKFNNMDKKFWWCWKIKKTKSVIKNMGLDFEVYWTKIQVVVSYMRRIILDQNDFGKEDN